MVLFILVLIGLLAYLAWTFGRRWPVAGKHHGHLCPPDCKGRIHKTIFYWGKGMALCHEPTCGRKVRSDWHLNGVPSTWVHDDDKKHFGPEGGGHEAFPA